MPGTRDGNLRGGDLSEGLGLEMLRPFAFIAPVPRPEDVGVDAVATLFSRTGRQLRAEESFLVQVKAKSVRSFHLEGDELDWLRSLTLPLFFMTVDIATTTIELRSLTRASSHPNYRDRKSITLHLDEVAFDLNGDGLVVSLGPPILRWTPADAVDPRFQQIAYEVLKHWIEFEMECIRVRHLGMTLQVKWETNQRPEPTDTYAIMSQRGQFQAVLEKMQPYMHWLTAQTFDSDCEVDDLLTGLLCLTHFMRRHGVDCDQSGMLGVIARMRADHGLQRPKGTDQHRPSPLAANLLLPEPEGDK
jgi:hypothetical protein